MAMRLAIGAVPYFWERQKVFDFYREVARSTVEVVYLGETICSKRRELTFQDWFALAEDLAAAGKEVVMSTLALIEADSELAALRRIVDNGRFMVEANDMAAVAMLSDRGLPFVVGSHINAYNNETLRLLSDLGARRWVVPVEVGRDTLAARHGQRSDGLETEVLIYGRLPLAFSARCYTARAHNLPKDACAFVCRNYPDGLPLLTMEQRPFLVLNGIQTRSAEVCNLIAEMREIQALGVDIVRVSPQSAGTAAIIEIVREVVDGRRDPAAAAHGLAAQAAAGHCNGYWYGRAGMERSGDLH